MPILSYESSVNEISHITTNHLWMIAGVFLIMTQISQIISYTCVVFSEHQVDIYMVCIFMTVLIL